MILGHYLFRVGGRSRALHCAVEPTYRIRGPGKLGSAKGFSIQGLGVCIRDLT